MFNSGASSSNSKGSQKLSNCKSKRLEYQEKEVLIKSLKILQNSLEIQLRKDKLQKEKLEKQAAMRKNLNLAKNGCPCGSNCNGRCQQRQS